MLFACLVKGLLISTVTTEKCARRVNDDALGDVQTLTFFTGGSCVDMLLLELAAAVFFGNGRVGDATPASSRSLIDRSL